MTLHVSEAEIVVPFYYSKKHAEELNNIMVPPSLSDVILYFSRGFEQIKFASCNTNTTAKT